MQRWRFFSFFPTETNFAGTTWVNWTLTRLSLRVGSFPLIPSVFLFPSVSFSVYPSGLLSQSNSVGVHILCVILLGNESNTGSEIRGKEPPLGLPINYYSLRPFLSSCTVVLLQPRPRWPAYRKEGKGRKQRLGWVRTRIGTRKGWCRRKSEWRRQDGKIYRILKNRGRVKDSSGHWACHIWFGQRERVTRWWTLTVASLTSSHRICWMPSRSPASLFFLLLMLLLPLRGYTRLALNYLPGLQREGRVLQQDSGAIHPRYAGRKPCKYSAAHSAIERHRRAVFTPPPRLNLSGWNRFSGRAKVYSRWPPAG